MMDTSNAILLAILLCASLGFVVFALRARNATADRPTDATITFHARSRMAERGVTEAQVLATVASPEHSRPDNAQQSVKLERAFGHRTLIVWVVAPWPASAPTVKSTAWSNNVAFTVPVAAIGHIVGKAGHRISSMERDMGVRIHIDGDRVSVYSKNLELSERAMHHILRIADRATQSAYRTPATIAS